MTGVVLALAGLTCGDGGPKVGAATAAGPWLDGTKGGGGFPLPAGEVAGRKYAFTGRG
jgi:hypothetical protein